MLSNPRRLQGREAVWTDPVGERRLRRSAKELGEVSYCSLGLDPLTGVLDAPAPCTGSEERTSLLLDARRHHLTVRPHMG